MANGFDSAARNTIAGDMLPMYCDVNDDSEDRMAERKADELERKVRERAYQIWEQEGRLHGRDLEHWLQAERSVEVEEEEEPLSPRRKAASRAGKTSVRPRKRAAPRTKPN